MKRSFPDENTHTAHSLSQFSLLLTENRHVPRLRPILSTYIHPLPFSIHLFVRRDRFLLYLFCCFLLPESEQIFATTELIAMH